MNFESISNSISNFFTTAYDTTRDYLPTISQKFDAVVGLINENSALNHSVKTITIFAGGWLTFASKDMLSRTFIDENNQKLINDIVLLVGFTTTTFVAGAISGSFALTLGISTAMFVTTAIVWRLFFTTVVKQEPQSEHYIYDIVTSQIESIKNELKILEEIVNEEQKKLAEEKIQALRDNLSVHEQFITRYEIINKIETIEFKNSKNEKLELKNLKDLVTEYNNLDDTAKSAYDSDKEKAEKLKNARDRISVLEEKINKELIDLTEKLEKQVKNDENKVNALHETIRKNKIDIENFRNSKNSVNQLNKPVVDTKAEEEAKKLKEQEQLKELEEKEKLAKDQKKQELTNQINAAKKVVEDTQALIAGLDQNSQNYDATLKDYKKIIADNETLIEQLNKDIV